MQDNYILWLTGLDTILRREQPALGPREIDSICTEICNSVAEKLLEGKTVAKVRPFPGGRIAELGRKRVALIAAPDYSPERLEADVAERGLTHVVFLRAPRPYTRRRFVEVAAGLQFSFFKQQMPDPVLIRHKEPASDPHTPDGFTAMLRTGDPAPGPNVNITVNINGGNFNVAQGNNIRQTARQDNSTSRKSWKDYLGDLLVNITGGIITNCGFFSALTRF